MSLHQQEILLCRISTYNVDYFYQQDADLDLSKSIICLPHTLRTEVIVIYVPIQSKQISVGVSSTVKGQGDARACD